MSKILERISEIQAVRESRIDPVVASELTAQYIAGLKAEAKAEMDRELKDLLVAAADEAERELWRAERESLDREICCLNETLSEYKSRCAQMGDLIKALQADISRLEKVVATPCGHDSIISDRDARISDLEQKLLTAETLISPPPQIVELSSPVPVSFEFKPERSENGLIKSVSATPVYRN